MGDSSVRGFNDRSGCSNSSTGRPDRVDEQKRIRETRRGILGKDVQSFSVAELPYADGAVWKVRAPPFVDSTPELNRNSSTDEEGAHIIFNELPEPLQEEAFSRMLSLATEPQREYLQR